MNKLKANLAPILFSVVFLTILLMVFFKIFLESNIKQHDLPKNTSVEKTSDDWDWESATKPEFGRLYLTSDNNEQGIYYTTKNMQESFFGSSARMKPYYGKFVGLESLRTEDGYFHFLKDPKPFKQNVPVSFLTQFSKGSSKDIYYGFLTWEDGEENFQNSIFKIDVKQLTISKIWNNRFSRNSNTNKGEVVIDRVTENYLFATVYSCWECEGEELGKLLINLSTGKDVYLNDVTDFEINFLANTFSYHELLPIKENCASPNQRPCDSDGTVIVKKPGDQIFTQPLP